MKIRCAVLLICLVPLSDAYAAEAVFISAVTQGREEPEAVFTAAAAATATIDKAAVEACLESARKKSWDAREARKKQAQSQGSVPYTFHAVEASALPNSCVDGNLEAFQHALKIQIAYCNQDKTKSELATVQFGCRTFTRNEWCKQTNERILALAQQNDSFEKLTARVREEFDWYQSDGVHDTGKFIKKGEVQFTAYDAPPPIDASSVPTAKYRYPLYRKPPELVKLTGDQSCGIEALVQQPIQWCLQPSGGGSPVQAPTRSQIDLENALAGRGLEIAYVADPLDIAYVQIQGSGSIRLHKPDGRVELVHINYDGQNGHPLYMMSQVLGCYDANLHSPNWADVVAYINGHPEIKSDLMNMDQSYVFFKTAKDGPFGDGHILLTPRHSMATDRSLIPAGVVALFQTARPGGSDGKCDQTTSLAIAQDSGGYIKGAHVDWYMGETQEAKETAERMNAGGSLFVAVPKGGGQAVPGCTP